MKYRIEGMTCLNCVDSVKRALEELPTVASADIQLSGVASLDLKESVTLEQLQTVLPQQFTIKAGGPSWGETIRHYAVEYRLLIGIYLLLGFILFTSLLFGVRSEHELMNRFMGWFFILFGVVHLYGIKVFPSMFAEYNVLARRVPFYGVSYPFLELILGVCFLWDLYPLATNITTAVIMGIGGLSIAWTLLRGARPTCACLGGLSRVPITWFTAVIEEGLMAAMAVHMIFAHIL